MSQTGKAAESFLQRKEWGRGSGADGTAARATRPEPLQAASLACLLDAAVKKPQPPPVGRRGLLRNSWAAFRGSSGAYRASGEAGGRLQAGLLRGVPGPGRSRAFTASSGTAGNPGSRVVEGREWKLGAGGRQAAA